MLTVQTTGGTGPGRRRRPAACGAAPRAAGGVAGRRGGAAVAGTRWRSSEVLRCPGGPFSGLAVDTDSAAPAVPGTRARCPDPVPTRSVSARPSPVCRRNGGRTASDRDHEEAASAKAVSSSASCCPRNGSSGAGGFPVVVERRVGDAVLEVDHAVRLLTMRNNGVPVAISRRRYSSMWRQARPAGS